MSPPDSPNSKASSEAEKSPEPETPEQDSGHDHSLPMVTPGRFPRSSLPYGHEDDDEDEDEDLSANDINTAISDEETVQDDNSELVFTADNHGKQTPQQSRPKRSLTLLNATSPSPQTSKIVIYPSLLEDIRALLSTIRDACFTASAEYADIQRTWTSTSEQAWASLNTKLSGEEGEARITFKDMEDDISLELSRFLTTGDGIKRFKVNVVQGDIIHKAISQELEATKSLHAEVNGTFLAEEENAEAVLKLIEQRMTTAKDDAEAVRQRKDKKVLKLEKELEAAKAEIEEMKKKERGEAKTVNGGGFRLFG